MKKSTKSSGVCGSRSRDEDICTDVEPDDEMKKFSCEK